MERKNDEKLFLLIDGSAILHRAYHAMPGFITAKGVQTGAVHGFFSMLLKLLQELKPFYLAVSFDRPKPTFRQEMYVGYQANRPKVGVDLGDQFTTTREILHAAHIPVYEVDGFEADDVIGTVSSRLSKEKDIKVLIITGDRDMLQLISKNTKVLMPIKGISEVMIFDDKRVKEKYGIEPYEVIDYKALIGDASDNYPGVPGIGPKTAVTLLSEYKTLEGIFGHIKEIEQKNPKLAKKLAEGSDQAYLAKKLATIVCDVPFIFSLKDCEVTNILQKDFSESLLSFELNTINRRFGELFNGISDSKKNQMKLL